MRKGLLGARLPFWGWGCMATGPLNPQSREGGVGVRVTTVRRPARPLWDPQPPVPPSSSVVSSSLSLTLTCAEEQPGAFLPVCSPGERGAGTAVGKGVSSRVLGPCACRPARHRRPLSHPVSGSLAHLLDVSRIS